MENDHISDLFNDYLEGSLDHKMEQKVRDHLKVCEDCASEFENMKILFQEFKDEEPIFPSNNLKVNFLKNLEKEKREIDNKKVITLDAKNRTKWNSYLLRVAAGIVLMLGGYWFGLQQQQGVNNDIVDTLKEENNDNKQLAMISLMESQSASQRIKGVYISEQFEDQDEEIVNALIQTMKYDVNANVRLTAVEALERFSKLDNVKKAFIESLSIEKSPNIQISLIQMLVKIQEKRALQPMMNLMENDSTVPFVKEQLKSLIPVLS